MAVEKRARNWTFVLYPESAPDNWRDILDDLHMQWAASPLHDQDLNPDGEVKKAHYHIALSFEGKKSYSQISDITKSVNATIPQVTASLRGLIRYFVHLDNPEKHQYSVDDIESHGGLDVAELLRPTCSDTKAALRDIVQFIKDNDITEFHELIDYALANNEMWFDLLSSGHTIFITSLLSSRRNSPVLSYYRHSVDPETGELLPSAADLAQQRYKSESE